ncbi:MAG: hypothetical protein ABIL89_07395 [candidate division WOR-3 bacterium]
MGIKLIVVRAIDSRYDFRNMPYNITRRMNSGLKIDARNIKNKAKFFLLNAKNMSDVKVKFVMKGSRSILGI